MKIEAFRTHFRGLIEAMIGFLPSLWPTSEVDFFFLETILDHQGNQGEERSSWLKLQVSFRLNTRTCLLITVSQGNKLTVSDSFKEESGAN